jgi:hypothetical protein
MDTGPVDVATALGSLVASAAWAVCMGRQVRALRQELSQAREDEACAREGAIATVAALRVERAEHQRQYADLSRRADACERDVSELNRGRLEAHGEVCDEGAMLACRAQQLRQDIEAVQHGRDGQ